MKNIYPLTKVSDGYEFDATSSGATFYHIDGTAALDCFQCPEPQDFVGDVGGLTSVDRLLSVDLDLITEEDIASLLPIAKSMISDADFKVKKATEVSTIYSLKIGKILNFFERATKKAGVNWVKFRKEHFDPILSKRTCQRYGKVARVKNAERWACLGIAILEEIAGIVEREPYASAGDPIKLLQEKYGFDGGGNDIVYDVVEVKAIFAKIIFLESVIVEVKGRDDAISDADLDCLDKSLLSKIAVESGFKPNDDVKHVKAAARAFLKGYQEDSQKSNKYLENYRQNIFIASNGNSTAQEPRQRAFNLEAKAFGKVLDFGLDNDSYFNAEGSAEIMDSLMAKLTSARNRLPL